MRDRWDPDEVASALGRPDALGRALARWLDDAVGDDEAARRSEARWLRLQTDQDATFVGALVDLAERGVRVRLDLGAHAVAGVVAALGEDVVTLLDERGGRWAVRLAAVQSLAPAPEAGDLAGARRPTGSRDLASLLALLAEDRADVAVRTARGTSVRGRLVRAGADVITLLDDGPSRARTWVPTAAIDVVGLDVR